jgi:hypothetical protein
MDKHSRTKNSVGIERSSRALRGRSIDVLLDMQNPMQLAAHTCIAAAKQIQLRLASSRSFWHPDFTPPRYPQGCSYFLLWHIRARSEAFAMAQSIKSNASALEGARQPWMAKNRRRMQRRDEKEMAATAAAAVKPEQTTGVEQENIDGKEEDKKTAKTSTVSEHRQALFVEVERRMLRVRRWGKWLQRPQLQSEECVRRQVPFHVFPAANIGEISAIFDFSSVSATHEETVLCST